MMEQLRDSTISYFEESLESLSIFGIGMTSYFYNIYSGTEREKIKIVIDVKDIETGEIFNTVTYPDALNELETE